MCLRRMKRRWGLHDLFITNYLCIALRMLVKSLITRVNVTLLSLWSTYKCTDDTNCKNGGFLYRIIFCSKLFFILSNDFFGSSTIHDY